MACIKSALYLILTALLIASVDVSHAAIVPDSGLLNFAVVRDGDQIGTYVLSFRQTNDRIDVTVKTRIAVKIAYITVYRFDHDGHETWQNGRLVQMETKTHDDGTDHKLQVLPDGTGKLRVIGDGKEMTARPDVVPASLWNPAFIRTNALMDSLVGKPLDIRIADRGEETVTVKGKSVKARHYSMTGELARELWYDENWVLVHMTLKGKDGSDVEYILN